MTTTEPDAVAPTRASRGRGTSHSLQIADIEPLCDDAVAIRFSIPPELHDEYTFRPGQSLTLSRTVGGVEHRRSYSICAPVGTAPRVGVREVDGGLFSRWLVHDVRPGDHIEVAPPAGSFHADPTGGGRHILIAAGSGITPMLSIASSLLENSDAAVTLIYANRKTKSVMFAEDIADLKDAHGPRFDIIHVLSREPREAQLFSGRLDRDRLDEILTSVVPTADIDHFWLCGPLGMVETAQEVLAARGVAPQQIHRELFYVEATPPPQQGHRERGVSGPTSEVTIVLDGRSVSGTLSRDASILDAGEDLRSDLPFACKGGVCGTCRAKVTCGQVDMRRNYALEDAEVAAGFVLTCQSFPTSADVTVDFDA